MTSPWWSIGTVTSSRLIGSRMTGSALAMRRPERQPTGDLERHLRAVDRVLLAVDERSTFTSTTG